MPRGNRTERRGNGPPPSRITIPAKDGKALRELLETRHGYSAEEAIPGLLSGELATVLLGDEERRALIAWVESGMDEPPNEVVRLALQSVSKQLRTATEA